MKLSLSTDFGSPHHWQRLVDFAQRHGAQRLVFWGDYSNARFTSPCLFPRNPELLTDEWRAQRRIIRERMAHAARLTADAGMEFWYCFQVLMLPPSEHVRAVRPEWFNAHGEPDMNNPILYQLLRDQIDELRDIAPNLRGLEMWIMECAHICISSLKHQTLPLEEICKRIVETVHDHCRQHGLLLAQDLHTAGGHKPMLDALLAAAQAHPDIIVGADNVIGDFHPHLPFNAHLRTAAATNPIQVHFDLNGEYWGRNFVPTSALSQYTHHIEEARALGAVYADGRISTGHDRWSPHDNILPSHRKQYPVLSEVTPSKPLPNNIEVCCFNTLGGFNAEYFCRRVRDSSAQASDVVREFLRGEFGASIEALADTLEEVEMVAGRTFFADKNYFGAQSILPTPSSAISWALDVHLTTPRGEPFPPPASAERVHHVAFAGWPVPLNHRAAGVTAMIEEKETALADAQRLLRSAQQATVSFRLEDRTFVLRQFEDLVFLARAAAVLLEAMAHYYHLKHGTSHGTIPDRERLASLVQEISTLAAQWMERYPDDRWVMANRLGEWHEVMNLASSNASPVSIR